MFYHALFDDWLETMRTPTGYGGAVAHWWQQSLMFCGAGFDWRYEGIIAGYLALWRRTGEPRWLERVRRAGDDLVNAQMASGHFPNSSFERNPSTAGTPHEAACSLGLLLLAQALPDGERYRRCAEKNLTRFYIDQLWDQSQGRFRDGIGTETFVPNKAATACEALLLLAKIKQNDELVERYVLPTLAHIMAHQREDGGIAQNSIGRKRIENCFPIYIARCVPALLQAHAWTNDERYLIAARDALAFIVRQIRPDGTLPTVIYADGSVNLYPAWMAGLGDILRAVELGKAAGIAVKCDSLKAQLRQDSSGAFQTAHGFAAQAGGKHHKLPDVRDVLHVVGWNDKAFRYLAEYGELSDEPVFRDLQIPKQTKLHFECECIFRGMRMHFVETAEELVIKTRRETVYRWCKGTDYPVVASAEFWLR